MTKSGGARSDSLYLDYAAATPMSPAVGHAMQAYLMAHFANPSAVYSAGIAARQRLDVARKDVSRILGVNHQNIIFTAGATESIHIAIHGAMRRFEGSSMVTSAIEHEAVLNVARQYSARIAPVDSRGIVRVQSIEDAIDDTTVLVSVMYANNEIGTVQPLSEIAAMIARIVQGRVQRGVSLPLWLHSDASQAASYLHLNQARLGVDLLSLNGGKMYGPKQSGVLSINPAVELMPYIGGGSQERGLRSGTENVAAAIGFAEALVRAQEARKTEHIRQGALRDRLQSSLQAIFPTMTVNGHLKHRLANCLNITLPGLDGERAVMALDEAGIMVATGSACSASSDKPSHVLRAIGLSDAEASSSLRITLGVPTTEKEIDQVIAVFSEILS